MVIEHLDMFRRVGAAAGPGGAIGYERQRAGRPAGPRTHLVIVPGGGLRPPGPRLDHVAVGREAGGGILATPGTVNLVGRSAPRPVT